MKWICIFFIKLYQKILSPLKRTPTCRFEPTCSSYAIEAFRERGFFAGMILTVSRIVRCNPFCAGGYDPVPKRGLRRFSYPEPMTKYYYPEEYGLEPDVSEANDDPWHRTGK